MKFTKQNFEKLRNDVNEILQPLAEKYALSMTAGNISYREDTFSIKVDCVKTDVGDVKKKEFDTNCAMYGLSPDDYKREFVTNGKKYALVGLSLGSSKYPFICIDLRTQQEYKFSRAVIHEAFGK